MRNVAASRLSAVCVVTLLLSPAMSAAQQRGSTELGEAFELERRGRYEVASRRYRDILGRRPTNLSALLGLERVLPPINQLDSILPHIDSALVLQPEHGSVRALPVRVFAKLERPDRVTEAARAWIAAMPLSSDPYREWSSALKGMGDVIGARRVLEEGASQLGTASLSQEMAELAVLDADWTAAARYWRDATRENPALLSAAVTNLIQAPIRARTSIVDLLIEDRTDRLSGRMAADLLVSWNRPEEGWVILDRSLPRNAQEAAPLLRRFADRAHLVRSREGSRARGMALERLAQLSVGSAAQRARIDAASAYADAAADLRQKIAWAWIREPDLDRAETVLGDDSTVTVLAVRGWIALYRGDLRGTTDFFRGAGPRAGSRAEVTERTAILALVQTIKPDSVPALGDALLQLVRDDTTGALDGLDKAAAAVPARGGRAGVLTYAGRLALAHDDYGRAEQSFLRAIAADAASASAPAARYHLARAYEKQGRKDQALTSLEGLILEYPESAIVPLARRMLDRLRGAVPAP